MPLTPDDVQDVRFDHAPLGKRGYNEDEVDDFLDQVELALRGEMKMSAQNIREIEFDQGGLVRRGYDEQQVDEFLEAIVTQLEGGEPNYVVKRANGHSRSRSNGHGGLINGSHSSVDIIEALEAVDQADRADQAAADKTVTVEKVETVEIAPNGNGGGRIIGTLHEAITESVNGHSNGHSTGHTVVAPTEPVPAHRPAVTPRPEPEPDPNSIPLPPAVPGLHGYRQRDVQRMAACVRAAVDSPHGPTSEDIARMRLERVEDGEKGYDPFLVEALRDAWVAELRRQGR